MGGVAALRSPGFRLCFSKGDCAVVKSERSFGCCGRRAKPTRLPNNGIELTHGRCALRSEGERSQLIPGTFGDMRR